ncbi:MAG: hypothetical protein Q7U53_08465 [Anaerolineaceae bacterium]|nr:hypothetical protein [Anaerolineaceae bacterium]
MVSHYPIRLSGFGKQKIELEVTGLLGKTKIIVDDLPAERGNKKDEYILYRPDGSQASVFLQGMFFDIIPKLIINGETFEILPPLKWHQYVFAGLGLFLIFYGGGVGGILGMISFIINIRLLRSFLSSGLRNLLILFVNVFAFFIFNLLVKYFPIIFF